MSEKENNRETMGDSNEKREQRDPEIVREISLEEFQPKGTLALTLLYFVIVLLMWIFMYFIEFAGNAPSIID